MALYNPGSVKLSGDTTGIMIERHRRDSWLEGRQSGKRSVSEKEAIRPYVSSRIEEEVVEDNKFAKNIPDFPASEPSGGGV